MKRKGYQFRGSGDRAKKRRKLDQQEQPEQLEQPKVQHRITKEKELKKMINI